MPTGARIEIPPKCLQRERERERKKKRKKERKKERKKARALHDAIAWHRTHRPWEDIPRLSPHKGQWHLRKFANAKTPRHGRPLLSSAVCTVPGATQKNGSSCCPMDHPLTNMKGTSDIFTWNVKVSQTVKTKIIEFSTTNIQNIQRFSNPHLLNGWNLSKSFYRQETPNSVEVRKSMYQIQANTSDGTVADQVGHYRNDSSRDLSWHKQQRNVYSPGCHTRTYENPIPGHIREFQKIVKQGPSTSRISQDLHTRTSRSIPKELSYKHQRRVPSLAAGPCWGWFPQDFHKIFSKDLKRTCTRSCKDLLEDFTSVSTRASHQEFQNTLTKIFMPGPLRESH